MKVLKQTTNHRYLRYTNNDFGISGVWNLCYLRPVFWLCIFEAPHRAPNFHILNTEHHTENRVVRTSAVRVETMVKIKTKWTPSTGFSNSEDRIPVRVRVRCKSSTRFTFQRFSMNPDFQIWEIQMPWKTNSRIHILQKKLMFIENISSIFVWLSFAKNKNKKIFCSKERVHFFRCLAHSFISPRVCLPHWHKGSANGCSSQVAASN